MPFVCPKPQAWHRAYSDLVAAWESAGQPGPPPPRPLILAGWAFSNDVDKHERWRETLAWAAGARLDHLIPALAEEERHIVPVMSDYHVGPSGGPMFLPWNSNARERPGAAVADAALRRPKEQWGEVAGPVLASHAQPLRLTGRKLRRLVVEVDRAQQAPWGAWDRLAAGATRRAFTRLRSAVNGVLRPLEVDHIDFVGRPTTSHQQHRPTRAAAS